MEKIVYYTFQCDVCFLLSGYASRSPDDAPSCCGGELMTPIYHEVEIEKDKIK